MPPSGAAPKKKGEQRIGDFVLADELQSSGSARVFRALYAPEKRDRTLRIAPGEHAILKVLRDVAARDEKISQLFTREAEVLAMIDHPNIVRFITRGVTGGRVWTALEYVEGEELATVFRVMQQEKVRLRPELVASIAADLLAGLSSAQQLTDHRSRTLGLIHRDVTPKSVMLDLKGRAKLVDFGAVLLSLREEPTVEVVGTPGYLAPEQAKKEQLTQGVDVYQVGLVMFELLTGERAFPIESATDEALLRAHANNRRAPWPRGLDVPIEIKALVDQALGTTPEERPTDAAAFYALVEQLVQDPEESHRRLALVARDLVRTNPEKPEPLYA